MSDVITGVAILIKGGAMVALPKPHRHHHIYALAAFMGIDLDSGRQGFVTSNGSFVDRREAFRLVAAHGQANRRSGNSDSEELFSEDVW